VNLAQPQYTPFAEDGIHLAALLAPFDVVRFMDWQQTNGSTCETLADCESGERYSGGKWSEAQRIPLSACIDIANRLDVRAWLCVPHLLPRAELVAFVERVVERCKRRPIIEWSNEVWNGQFAQHAALDRQITQSRLIKEAAGNSADVVLCGQFWSVARSRLVASHLRGLDAYALAPYYGRTLAQQSPRDMRHVYKLAQAELDEVAETLEQHREAVGLPIWAYEGGWHGAAHAVDDMERVRLRELFCAYARSQYAAHDAWRLWSEIFDGGVRCPYALATTYGAEQWGHVELVNGEYRPMPKYRAVAKM